MRELGQQCHQVAHRLLSGVDLPGAHCTVDGFLEEAPHAVRQGDTHTETSSSIEGGEKSRPVENLWRRDPAKGLSISTTQVLQESNSGPARPSSRTSGSGHLGGRLLLRLWALTGGVSGLSCRGAVSSHLG